MGRFSSEKFMPASVVKISGLIHNTTTLVVLVPDKNVAKQQIGKEETKTGKHHLSAKICAHLLQ